MAGVSIATVSNVINGTRPVRPETRQRVMAAIEKLKYMPDNSARHFKTGKKSTIGFIVPDICNTFFPTLVEAVEEILGCNHYDLIVANTHENVQREAEHLQRLSSGIVDALIVASCFESYADLSTCIPAGFPVVLIDRLPINSQCDTVRADSYEAILESIEYLIAHGHKKIGMLAWQENLSTTKERVAAYRHAAKMYSFPPVIRYVGIDSGVACAAEELMEEHCTALLIGNSKLYVELMRLESAVNYHPAVVSFSDTPEYEHLFRGVPIIKQPTQKIGHLAGRMILERLQYPKSRTRREEMCCLVFFSTPRGIYNVNSCVF